MTAGNSDQTVSDLVLDRRTFGDAQGIPGLQGLPAEFAPLIRNAWYVIAETKDVGRELRAIKVLGEPLVMFRSEADNPVVLDDRCAHRRFPLSKSRLVGDTIQCGYHGFTYDVKGCCVWAPGMKISPRCSVRHYPSAEVGPWLWVWMGDPEKADRSQIPFPDVGAGNWHAAEGYKLNPGNFMLLIENLLDLTHLHFLHGADVSDHREADNPPRTAEVAPNCVSWTKDTPRSALGFFAQFYGGDPDRQVRVVTWQTQFGPSLNYGGQDRLALEGNDAPVQPAKFRVIHAITPVDENSTHQFFQVMFDSPPSVPITVFRDISRDQVFQQDCDAIGYMHAAIVEDRRSGGREFSIGSDRFGVRMRKILRDMHQLEVAVPSLAEG